MWFVLGLVVFFLLYVWFSAGSEPGDHSAAANEVFAEAAEPMKIVWPGQLFASTRPMGVVDDDDL